MHITVGRELPLTRYSLQLLWLGKFHLRTNLVLPKVNRRPLQFNNPSGIDGHSSGCLRPVNFKYLYTEYSCKLMLACSIS